MALIKIVLEEFTTTVITFCGPRIYKLREKILFISMSFFMEPSTTISRESSVAVLAGERLINLMWSQMYSEVRLLSKGFATARYWAYMGLSPIMKMHMRTEPSLSGEALSTRSKGTNERERCLMSYWMCFKALFSLKIFPTSSTNEWSIFIL